MVRMLVVFYLAVLGMSCAEEEKKSGPAVSGAGAAASQNSKQEPSTGAYHFFSVAWGCIEIEKSRLDAASYTVQDYSTLEGKCPETLKVVDTISKHLLNCPIVIGPKAVPATYILYDKRNLNGTISDLRAEGFTTENFCPAISQKNYK